jgi:cytosine permease
MAKPNPPENRAPWYKSTAPAYAGIFLWVVFYMAIAQGTLSQAGLGLSLLGLVIAALLCHFLYYLVPGLFGMKTGYPLYVVGASTYGSLGGFLVPGLLMGLLQFGWLAVNTAIATDFILQAAGKPPAQDPVTEVFTGSAAFTIVAIIWALVAVSVALKGIQYLGKVSTFLPIVPLVMILIVFFSNIGTVGKFTPDQDARPLMGMLGIIAYVVGFFATAGAAGVDFGMGNRNKKDVQLGGLVGIALAILVAGGLPLIAIAGAHGANPDMESFTFATVIQTHFLSKVMFILFAVASFPAACFCSFIAANSITTMFPKANRAGIVLVGAVVAIILAATGWALDLSRYFGIIGASFGPICGSMAADYLLSGCKWSGPRRGWNLAGYISLIVGFIVGMLPTIAPEAAISSYISPAPVIAFIIGFVLYIILAKAGLEPPAVEMAPASAKEPEAPGPAAPQAAAAEETLESDKGQKKNK